MPTLIVIFVAIFMIFPGCTTVQPRSDLRRQANELCWALREQLKDPVQAAAACVAKVKTLDGVVSARTMGASLVKVRFEDSSEEYGIWLK